MKTVEVAPDATAITDLLGQAREQDILVRDAEGREYMLFAVNGFDAHMMAIADFQASAETRARVEELIRREKTVGLSAAEKAELDQFMNIEHLMVLAKARARLQIRNKQ